MLSEQKKIKFIRRHTDVKVRPKERMLLELKDIKMDYAKGRAEIPSLLNGVNLVVKEGKVTALLGGNGTGKTTLFNIISGFEKSFQGQVLFDGHDIARMPAYRISRMGIGRLFQGTQLMSDLTLMENMKIASDDTIGEDPFDVFFHSRKLRQSEAAKEQKAIEVIERLFGKDNAYCSRLDDKVTEFSYGEQRLMAMARLLMGNNRLLLLDEPTSGVNPKYIEIFQRVIRDMVEREKVTVLLIEHNMSFVRNVADVCYYLAASTIMKSGDTEEVLEDASVRKDYMGYE